MKVTETKERLKSMLAENRDDMNEATREAAYKEFARVAKEYFETDGELGFQIAQAGSGYKVTINFRAVRVKNFTTLK